MQRYLRLARRALRRPLGFVALRAMRELRVQAERYLAPRRTHRFRTRQLLDSVNASSISELWERLAKLPYATGAGELSRAAYEAVCPGDIDRILRAAERAIEHRIDLLGSGEITLGTEINWHRDFKSGYEWPRQYSRDIEFMTPVARRDVKCPWELSRMQWAIPLGQAYLLTGEERYAAAARELIESWISSNPYSGSVNWACAMDVALRVLTWSWFFHAFSRSSAWNDEGFRGVFLVSLYLHADFVDRHFEFSDINENHCDADAAGLVFAGLFFGEGGAPQRWLDRGWRVLTREIQLQVSEDGVDFEGSVPYHRLVTELFFLPALYRIRRGLPVPDQYRSRLRAMARFTEAYTRPDGSAPCWGDADDGRALPFGGQHINDHRYLLGWIGATFGDQALTDAFEGDAAECVWLLGLETGVALVRRSRTITDKSSVLFSKGGYAVLRNDTDHVFVDCGPVGMAGRGGHGHNDVLSCEIVLDGCHLVADCGAFVYTASFEARNSFRSTAFHNTPYIDRQEINRFVHPNELWMLHDDARAQVVEYRCGPEQDILCISHTGYERFASPVRPVRTYTLDHRSHAVRITDRFEGFGIHEIEVPLHLAVGIGVEQIGKLVVLSCGNRAFKARTLSDNGWSFSVEDGRLSPSYGVVCPIKRLIWRRKGPARDLDIELARV